MHSKIWLILTVGFGTLIALFVLVGYNAIRQSRLLQQDMIASNESYLETESLVRGIPADIHLGGLLARDYLLDPSHITAPMHRKQLLELRTEAQHRLNLLEKRVGGSGADTLQGLRKEVEGYWDSFDPIFQWTPAQKATFGAVFLRQQVLPKRDAALALADQIARWNTTNFEHEKERLRATQRQLEGMLRRTIIFALAFGIPIAILTIHRVSTLEGRSSSQKARAERAESELRRLSSQLVHTQEDERKALSRELHDAVGQMLTGLRMELANLENARGDSPARFAERIQDAKSLAEETLRAVRDLAMGLRPSMLDDLGLGPALEWQGREFSRRMGVPVHLQIDGSLDQLLDSHRTCIFRIVQESLNNCAKHAHPTTIRVLVHGGSDRVNLTVQDDGVGFDSEAGGGAGLGLISIEERVRELDGTVTLFSQPNRGTMLRVELPLETQIAHG